MGPEVLALSATLFSAVSSVGMGIAGMSQAKNAASAQRDEARRQEELRIQDLERQRKEMQGAFIAQAGMSGAGGTSRADILGQMGRDTLENIQRVRAQTDVTLASIKADQSSATIGGVGTLLGGIATAAGGVADYEAAT